MILLTNKSFFFHYTSKEQIHPSKLQIIKEIAGCNVIYFISSQYQAEVDKSRLTLHMFLYFIVKR